MLVGLGPLEDVLRAGLELGVLAVSPKVTRERALRPDGAQPQLEATTPPHATNSLPVGLLTGTGVWPSVGSWKPPMLRLAAILTLLPALAFADITGTASVIDGDNYRPSVWREVSRGW